MPKTGNDAALENLLVGSQGQSFSHAARLGSGAHQQVCREGVLQSNSLQGGLFAGASGAGEQEHDIVVNVVDVTCTLQVQVGRCQQ